MLSNEQTGKTCDALDHLCRYLTERCAERRAQLPCGRKEALLPFMIANKLDGAGSSYYTMGDRKYPELRTYFENIKATMSSVTALAHERTIIEQMLVFSDPLWQLPRYLETMEDAGLVEVFLPMLRREADGRLWRSVPSRRWYSQQRGETPGSQEVVLIHQKRA
jgi:hypothetical protein